MRYTLVALPVTMTVLFLADLAHACRCAPPPPPEKALKKASAVFLGKVKSIEKSGLMVKATFEVETNFKGVDKKEVVVTTASDSARCGYRFTEGEVYVVYCYGKLQTGTCSRTRPASKAKGDLEALGEGTPIE